MDITPEQIIEMETEQLYKLYKMLLEESKEHEKETTKIKKGVKIKIPINYITKEWYCTYPSTKKVTVLGHGKYKIEDFYEEKDHRDKIMRMALIQHLEQEETIRPRA